jgi:uncharacterized repeat protein (TIGR02543 family)
MNSDRFIVAGFTGCAGPLEITVNYSTYSKSSTTINASFGSITTSATGTATGTTINVTATAAEGYRFDGWTGAVNGSETTMSFITGSSEPITASFSKAAPAPWAWMITGIAAILFAGLFMYIMKSKKAGEPEEAQTDATVPPQPTPPTGE